MSVNDFEFYNQLDHSSDDYMIAAPDIGFFVPFTNIDTGACFSPNHMCIRLEKSNVFDLAADEQMNGQRAVSS